MSEHLSKSGIFLGKDKVITQAESRVHSLREELASVRAEYEAKASKSIAKVHDFLKERGKDVDDDKEAFGIFYQDYIISWWRPTSKKVKDLYNESYRNFFWYIFSDGMIVNSLNDRISKIMNISNMATIVDDNGENIFLSTEDAILLWYDE
jgi:intergrase/recombinase